MSVPGGGPGGPVGRGGGGLGGRIVGLKTIPSNSSKLSWEIWDISLALCLLINQTINQTMIKSNVSKMINS